MIYIQLFLSFFQISLFSFGGGYAALPLIQGQVVNVHHWLSMTEFTDLITIAEITPGPVSINSSTFVGTRLAGPLGAVLCTLGCIIPSFIICLTLAHFYYKYRSFSGVQTVLSALRPAVVAMIGSAGMSILMLALFNTSFYNISLAALRPIELILFAGSLFLLRRFHGKVGAVSIILGSGAVGTLAYVLCGAL